MSYLSRVKDIKMSWPSPESYEIEHITIPKLWKQCGLIARDADDQIKTLEAQVSTLRVENMHLKQMKPGERQ